MGCKNSAICGGGKNSEGYMDYSMINYDEHANIYSQYRNESIRVISNIVSHTKETEIKNVLEIGCGTADHLYALKEMMKFDGYGFDRSNEMLKNASIKNPGLMLTNGDANDMFPYENSKFDLAYSINVIHYIDNLEQYFEESYRTLNDKGLMLTVTVSIDEMNGNISRYFPEFELSNSKSKGLVGRIAQVMSEVGFKDVHTTKSDYEYKMNEEDLKPFENRAFGWLKLLSDKGFSEGIELMRRDVSDGSCIGSENFTYIWGRK
jgi:ubiquinone/menaquinone biosynthesis C-methylase UbiE